ncbi:hypothetical protein AMK59_4893 [Oryctes borbonicus]|uniref:DED domain-containing protein n=1 Tax=Oryctes borbonicus TaxID=1629725 RepID=A0A0T6B525_9SCAR|nr:hypothetical protein AMK59_4893 [Oryctes borbonicus]
MVNEYETIIQNFSRVSCTNEELELLKTKYSSDVSSERALERCRSVFDLIKLLEKRDVFSVDDIGALKVIAHILNRMDTLNVIEQNNRTSNMQGTAELSNRIFLIPSTLLVTFHYSVCWFYHV